MTNKEVKQRHGQFGVFYPNTISRDWIIIVVSNIINDILRACTSNWEIPCSIFHREQIFNQQNILNTSKHAASWFLNWVVKQLCLRTYEFPFKYVFGLILKLMKSNALKRSKVKLFLNNIYVGTICPRSLKPLYIVTLYIKSKVKHFLKIIYVQEVLTHFIL